MFNTLNINVGFPSWFKENWFGSATKLECIKLPNIANEKCNFL